jgi:uncharacterized protein (TIGR02391 family)
MINWKLISTILSQEFSSPGLGGKYNLEFLVRSWKAHFDFQPENHFDSQTMSGNYAIFYNFFMTLSNQKDKSDNKKASDIIELLYTINKGVKHDYLVDIFARGGYKDEINFDYTSNTLSQFGQFHPEIIKHCAKLFEQKNYFHAVQEACKAYNNKIKKLSGSDKDGIPLMQNVLNQKGNLKLNPNITESELNEQNGIMSLSIGLMSAFRNPTSHENATEWNITKLECIQILNLNSFLFNKLDKATIIKN